MLNVQSAKEELENKNYAQIQRETAWKWASRAAACYEKCTRANASDSFVLWSLGQEYHSEAIEHSAHASLDGSVVKEIVDAVFPYQESAAKSMGFDAFSYEGNKGN